MPATPAPTPIPALLPVLSVFPPGEEVGDGLGEVEVDALVLVGEVALFEAEAVRAVEVETAYVGVPDMGRYCIAAKALGGGARNVSEFGFEQSRVPDAGKLQQRHSSLNTTSLYSFLPVYLKSASRPEATP